MPVTRSMRRTESGRMAPVHAGKTRFNSDEQTAAAAAAAALTAGDKDEQNKPRILARSVIVLLMVRWSKVRRMQPALSRRLDPTLS